MKRAGLLVAAMLGLALVAPVPLVQARKGYHKSSKVTDYDILNFALNLEYLEAEFYSWAAFGKGLPAQLRGYGPPSVGGRKANLSDAAQAFAEQIALDEIAHVSLLRGLLGRRSVPQPEIDIGPVFTALAKAALLAATNSTKLPSFSVYDNDVGFYLASFIFEDVGVTAYKGAAALIRSKKYLSAAAGLLGTEAYHAGALRTILVSDARIEFLGFRASNIALAISNLRDAADGKADKDEGIFDAKKKPILAPGDRNHLVFGRSPQEVLSIVTLGAKNGKGGFFPNGLNGKIH